ncbi:unnamed protein product [Soboliphyme baturini]|uniref:DUF4789 domain-containing protein n=1 Tax=Soboliphyme baturini TaxID=241478 RepID=A0A183IVK5_9BILA|nr:unnamed protein product [Soboliphyme baturini]
MGFKSCRIDLIGCTYVKMTFSISGQPNNTYFARLHHSTYKISANIDLRLNYADFLKLIFTGMDESYCGVLQRKEKSKDFKTSELIKCEKWLFGYFLCLSKPYENCDYAMSSRCKYYHDRLECFNKHSFVIKRDAEQPYGKCPQTYIDFSKPCVCKTCSWTMWGSWSKPNGTCGRVAALRYRPRDGMNETICQQNETKSYCCEDMKIIYLEDCHKDKIAMALFEKIPKGNLLQIL